MVRDRGYYRIMRKLAIRKKCGILKRLNRESFDFYYGWTKNQSGRLAKGKIHCSCWMCRAKSYDELSIRDQRRKLDGLQQINENKMNMFEEEFR